MPDLIAIDFETYWKEGTYSVRDMGNWAYCHDPRFDAYLVGVCYVAHTGSMVNDAFPPALFDWTRCHGMTILAHNAAFDRAVFRRLQELGVIPFSVVPKEWICTQAMVRYLQVQPSLEDAAFHILGRTLDKGPREQASGVKGSVLAAMPEMRLYAAEDARACSDLWEAASAYWPEAERRVWAVTDAMGEQGVWVDVPHVEHQLERLDAAKAEAAGKIPWGSSKAPTATNPLKELCKLKGCQPPPSLDAKDPRFSAWKQDETVPLEVVEVVHGIKAYKSANVARKKVEKFLGRVRPDGRMESHLLYCGAMNTRRWSGGGQGLNFQNFNSDDKLVDMRGCIAAAPGTKLLSIDLSQIEPRVLAWSTGNREMLEKMQSGMSIYEAYARACRGWKGGELKKEDPKLYKAMKVAVLSGGYGGGAETFARQAAREGLAWTEDDCKWAVAEYRDANPLVVKFWRDLEEQAKACVGGTWRLRLPSGNVLSYRNVQRKKNSETNRWEIWAEQVKGEASVVYGGLLCENWCSSVARDYFADRLLALVACEFKPLFLVHDEYVLEVAEDRAEPEMELAMGIINRVIDVPWADGLPVACEGKVLDRYAK